MNDDTRWLGHTHRELYDVVWSGPGHLGSSDAQAMWRDIGSRLTVVSDDLRVGTGQLAGGWEGSAAEQVGRGLDRLGNWVRNSVATAERTGAALDTQAEHVATLRTAMPPPPESMFRGDMTADEYLRDPAHDEILNDAPGLPQFLLDDWQARDAERAEAARQAVQVMTTYGENSAVNKPKMFSFGAPVLPLDTTAGGPGGGTVAPVGFGGPGAGPAPGAFGAAAGLPAEPAPGFAGGVAGPPAGAVAAALPLPPGAGPAGRGSSTVPPRPGSPGSAGSRGGPAGPGLGRVPGAGGWRAEPGGPLGGRVGPGVPGGVAGGAAGGEPGAAGRGGGPGTAAEPARGRTFGAHPGFLPAGVGAGGGRQQEHRRPSYLLDDTDAFGDDRWFTAPVITPDDPLPPTADPPR